MNSLEALENIAKRLADVPYQEELQIIKNDLEKLQAIESTDLSEVELIIEKLTTLANFAGRGLMSNGQLGRILSKKENKAYTLQEFFDIIQNFILAQDDKLKKSKLLESKLKRYFEISNEFIINDEYQEYKRLNQEIQALLGGESNE